MMSVLRYYRSYILCIFCFILGCTITINLTPIDRTCKIENSDREHNMMGDSKLKDPELVVVILSAPGNDGKRLVLRQTWLKLRSLLFEDFGVRHYFVVGSLGLPDKQLSQLEDEQKKYKDVLLLPMYDSYGNLTQKVAHTFHWLNDQVDYGLGFSFVLKCDDDSFVRLDLLTEELVDIQARYLYGAKDIKRSQYLRPNLQLNKFSKPKNRSLYWGYFSGSARIKSVGKWKESDWISCDRYTPYAVGGGYVLSKDLILYIAKNWADLRYFNSEDVSVGLWLAPVNNILRLHDIRFDTEWTTRGCQNNYLITHNINEKTIVEMYESLLNNKKLCVNEIIKRHSYHYNWTAPPSQCCTKAIT